MKARSPYAEHVDWGLRPGDPGLGTPQAVPVDSRPLSEDEVRRWEESREAAWEELELSEQELAELEREAGGLEVPAGLRRWATTLTFAATGVLGLFVVGQVADTLGSIATLPPVLQWVVAGLLIGCTALIGLVVARLLGLYFGLRRNRQINLRVLDRLQERRELRNYAENRRLEARQQLTEYLATYPLEGSAVGDLGEAGLRDEEIDRLRAAREELTGDEAPDGTGAWLAAFQRGFQEVQDAAAARAINRRATKAGLAIAAAPHPLMDQIVLFYTCTVLVRDLMRIYHLRPTAGATATILVKVMLGAALAGRMEEFTEEGTNWLSGTLADSAVTGFLRSSIARTMTAKLAEGTVMGILIRRLGRQAIALLQPTRRK